MTTCPTPSMSIYGRLGGEPGIKTFVSSLYDIMARLPEAEYIWKWHPDDMNEVKDRLAAFLSGWLGGPMVYPQLYGPPMMRRRHMDFPIGPDERDIWLKCARMALDETVPDLKLRMLLDAALTGMAEHMRNRNENGQSAGMGCGCGVVEHMSAHTTMEQNNA
jgi:hemoglobin